MEYIDGSLTATITYGDNVLSDLKVNGDVFYIENSKLPDDLFTMPDTDITVQYFTIDGDPSGTYHHGENGYFSLVQEYPEDGYTGFIAGRRDDEDVRFTKLEANLEYLAMMLDVDIDEA